MGRSRGLEPPTSGTTNRRSNQLSYDRHTPRPNTTTWSLPSPRKGGGLRLIPPRSRALSSGASLLHKAPFKGSENCLFAVRAQDYFALTRWVASGCATRIVMIMVAPGDSSSDLLASRAGMQRVPSPKIELFQFKRFVDAELQSELIRLIDKDRRPSTVADPNGDDYFRTSETCDLDPAEPAVEQLETLLANLNEIDPTYGEPVQGQRYEMGQEFKAHTDYFTPGGPDYEKFCSVAGQRTWTFMIYLNDVEAGGATRFKAINKTFKPEPGKLLCWNNRSPDGSVNPATLHHGMKVRKGLKYVITKWYREKPWGWE